jgi:hypothetical protein
MKNYDLYGLLARDEKRCCHFDKPQSRACIQIGLCFADRGSIAIGGARERITC